MQAESSRIIRRSTRDIAYWSSISSSSLAPVAVSAKNLIDYESEMAVLELPSISFIAQSGSPQQSIRERSEIRRSSEHFFFLLLALSESWYVRHHVLRTRLGPGDLLFYDSNYPLDCDFRLRFRSFILRLSDEFVRNWVPNPGCLGRRCISDSKWGRVLANYVAQLSPEFVEGAPLPQAILIDQLGALLALTASEMSGSRAISTPVERSVRDQIYDHIKQRCPETSLQAADIASGLNVSKRTLHRALASCGETFGSMLIQARIDVASRMLKSPLFDRMTTAEVGRRAGFTDASHFTKVTRMRTGRTPLQIRRARHS